MGLRRSWARVHGYANQVWHLKAKLYEDLFNRDLQLFVELRKKVGPWRRVSVHEMGYPAPLHRIVRPTVESYSPFDTDKWPE